MTPPRVTPEGTYLVGEDALPAGATLGNCDLDLELRADGSIARIVSVAAGGAVLSGLAVRHWDRDAGLRLGAWDVVTELAPALQTQRFRLGDHLDVVQDVAAYDPGAPAPAACVVTLRLHNRGSRRLRLASAVFARLAPTPTGSVVHARYDRTAGALVVWNRDGPPCARAIAVSPSVSSWSVTDDHARAVDERWFGELDGRIDAGGGDPLGVLQRTYELQPEETRTAQIIVVMLPEGPESAAAVLAVLPCAAEAIVATRRTYDERLRRSQVMAPDAQLELGVRWAKANMLRVRRATPTGPGFTNDPGRSTACVGRDAAWFVHGCDYLDPGFSRALLDGFAARQEPGGKIVEWYDLRTGETHDDGLNVNDDTPLFVLAVEHHAATTGDAAALAALLPAALRAGEQLLAQRDERGLVRCTATGTGARGIVGWRNVIEGYRISGATTELNSEVYAALRALARMSRAANLPGADRWDEEALRLRAAIERDLRNPENGLYHLTIDVDGRVRSDLSCDLVFPVIFGVSDDETSARIVARLRRPDFWTPAGLRTVPRDAPSYDPAGASGLLGGVWVAVTFWYAFAAARFVPDVMAEALAASFAHYARDPRGRNTVPGQFSEWLHGETLANRGMMLSPWFAPRYLWAAIEGACGLRPALDGAVIAPNLPAGWDWLALRDVPLGATTTTWIVVRAPELRILTTGDAGGRHPVERFDADVTDDVRVDGDDVAVVALRRGETTTVFVGSRERDTVSAAVLAQGALAGKRPVRRYDSLRGRWCAADPSTGTAASLVIARGGFSLVEFREEGRPTPESMIG